MGIPFLGHSLLPLFRGALTISSFLRLPSSIQLETGTERKEHFTVVEKETDRQCLFLYM